MIDQAKANPGGLTYGSAGNGSASHLATLLLADTAGLDMVHVPYKGAGPAITDLIGGRLDFMITTLPSVVGFLDSGKAKPLAVTTQERSAAAARRCRPSPRAATPTTRPRRWYGFAVPEGHAAGDRRPSCATPPSPPPRPTDVRTQPRHRGCGGRSATRPRSSAASCRAKSKRWAELIKSPGLGLATGQIEPPRRLACEHAVLDLRLPDRDGLALIRTLRLTRPQARIVVVTDADSFATVVLALRAGADGFVPKPVDQGELINSLLDRAPPLPPVPQTPLGLHRTCWEHVMRVYEQCDRNMTRAAERLGMHRRSLQRFLSKRAPPPRAEIPSAAVHLMPAHLVRSSVPGKAGILLDQ